MDPSSLRTGNNNPSVDRSSIASQALQCFFSKHLIDSRVEQLPGGLSGAWAFKAVLGEKPFCLKGHRLNGNPAQLQTAHAIQLLAQQRNFSLLPKLTFTPDGNSLVLHKDRLWELMEWIPGSPILRKNRTFAHLKAGMKGLKDFHHFLKEVKKGEYLPLPAWEARVAAIRRLVRNFNSLTHSGKKFLLEPTFLEDLLEKVKWCCHQLEESLVQPPPMTAIQYCWGDARADNLLFQDERVIGFIDVAGLRLDGVASDLARFLGDFCLDHPDWFTKGLDYYGDISLEEVRLVRKLDAMGILASIANWFAWMQKGEIPVDIPAMEFRLVEWFERLGKWKERGTF
ncbi:MAG: aminoglycoside phosphotransferase family protein [Gemmataceae bacterium]|nr:aminoglycoside phosphotransferase family protein [Gemmataceae bacterium]